MEREPRKRTYSFSKNVGRLHPNSELMMRSTSSELHAVVLHRLQSGFPKRSAERGRRVPMARSGALGADNQRHVQLEICCYVPTRMCPSIPFKVAIADRTAM